MYQTCYLTTQATHKRLHHLGTRRTTRPVGTGALAHTAREAPFHSFWTLPLVRHIPVGRNILLY